MEGKKILAGLLLVSSLFADNILEQIDKKMAPGSSESYKKLINIEPDGTKKEFLLYQARKGSDKMVSAFLKPESEKGRTTLRVGDNMWLYLPDVGRAIRITSMQSVVGGVFNNSDIMRLDFGSEYDIVKEEDKGDELVVETKAKTDTIAYDRLLITVDKKTITPKQIECYTSTGMLIKTLYYKDIKDFGNGIKRPAVMETKSPLYKGYTSIMVYGKITPKQFSDESFTLENLSKVENLRR
ncbi:MAG: outer membrane lipoprotein-sorting protein [Campylobacterota bacterium]|nr:outer membrane lipoprotein-sorting protein [Campylobacterota bacterium]